MTTKMNTIATLAQFFKPKAAGYRARTDAFLEEYRFEKAREMESDCWDRWARIRFADGSELVIRDKNAFERNTNTGAEVAA